MEKRLLKYGVASKNYDSMDFARGDTYTRADNSFPPTNLACKENPHVDVLKTAKYILDFGCGVGRNLPWIMDNTSAQYIGVDPNENMTQYFWDVQRSEGHDIDAWKTRVTLYNDFALIPEDIKFDYVVSTFVLQHLGYRFIYPDRLNLTDITQNILSRMNDGAVFFAIEHDSEENWIPRWVVENKINLDVYIRSYRGLPELMDRDHTAPNGGHHLIIFRKGI